MPRCLGLNKYKKRCRKKIESGFYCCDNHKPINLEDNGMINCFCCCEDIKPNLFTNLKCGHSFHKECLKNWFESLNKNNIESYDSNNIIECPLCRTCIKDNKTEKNINIIENKNFYESAIIKFITYGL